MRQSIAIYDAYWSTAGGGEKYAAGLADVLSRSNDVVLLAHEPINREWLGERLAVDLSRVEVEIIDECDRLETTSAPFDLLFNLSYRSHGRNGAKRGVYVVHFPDRIGGEQSGYQRLLRNGLGRFVRRRNRSFELVSGFHGPDFIRWQKVDWTNGAGVIRLTCDIGTNLRLAFGRYIPGGGTRHIEVTSGGEVRGRGVLSAPQSKIELIEPLIIDVDVDGIPEGGEIVISSESDIAHELLGNGDRRRLGVPLVGTATGRDPRNALLLRASLLDTEPANLEWLSTYDVIVANSPFTQRWISTWWSRPSLVVEPPVGLRQPSEKSSVILSVGRFFADGRGHAKKQFEMVEAFRKLCAGGLTGWTLHLAGGCSPDDRPYLELVRNAAKGLPVVFHVDATGAELDELYSTASIYWHATGLGEDLNAHPERAEHFGITTVEAMSAGAVPIVFNGGGQPDIVRHGSDGFVFSNVDQLVGFTRRLADNRDLRSQFSQSCYERALTYGPESFARRVNEIATPRRPLRRSDLHL